MGRCIVSSLFLGVLLMMGLGSFQTVLSQDFPYAVPQAPEFDDRGNATESRDMEPPAPRSRSKRHSSIQGSDPNMDYRTVRPYSPPPGPQQISVPAAPSVGPIPYRPSAQVPSGRSPEPATVAPQPPQAQMMPDCTHFPQIIAQAPSEPEMRIAAQEYLTCLMHSGWNMEQARKHVIATIETTKMAR
jgi:hypothetical protein